MRMIDADALKTELDVWAKISQKPNHYAREEALYIIDCALTIDAVPVVRCKDCKHYQIDVLFNSNYCCGRRRKPDDYCSYGERKESEGST